MKPWYYRQRDLKMSSHHNKREANLSIHGAPTVLYRNGRPARTVCADDPPGQPKRTKGQGSVSSTPTENLAATTFLDFDRLPVVAFARSATRGDGSDRDRAVRLYYAVRDTVRYDPYTIDLSVRGMRASTTLAAGQGWCVPKAILLAACCRAVGIPARLGFADVRNHLSSPRLRERMKTDIFYWHGYTSIFIDDRWRKATPAFNIELCRKFNLQPLEFDGHADALFHPHDRLGNEHMEYIRYRGEFSDLPLERMVDSMTRHYGASPFPPEAEGAGKTGCDDPDFL
jgi:transglutaminase-like putative cysteine protease